MIKNEQNKLIRTKIKKKNQFVKPVFETLHIVVLTIDLSSYRIHC